MLTVLHPEACRSERSTSKRVNIRLGAHCTERPEVNQDKPNSKPWLAPRPEALHTDRLRSQCSWDAPTSTPAFRYIPSLRCQEIHPAVSPRAEKVALMHGCEAGGARRDRTDDLKLAKLALSQLSYGPDPLGEQRRGSDLPAHHELKWWAWEDLNFRPHAYQARALTN